VNKGQVQSRRVIPLQTTSCHKGYPILDPRATLRASCPVFRALSYAVLFGCRTGKREYEFSFDMSIGRNRIVIATIHPAKSNRNSILITLGNSILSLFDWPNQLFGGQVHKIVIRADVIKQFLRLCPNLLLTLLHSFILSVRRIYVHRGQCQRTQYPVSL
jgi:hypothetical protein